MDIWLFLVVGVVSFDIGFVVAWLLARKRYNKNKDLAPLLGVVFPKEK